MTPTPPQVEQTEREAFEAWAARNGYSTFTTPGAIGPDGLMVYHDARTHAAWWAWQERASMQAQASDKAKGPGCNTEASEAGQEPPTHNVSLEQGGQAVSTDSNTTMPALPVPAAGNLLRPGSPAEKVYTADQMREYAKAATQALQREVAATYNQWCGRDYMHLPLSEAVGSVIGDLQREVEELRAGKARILALIADDAFSSQWGERTRYRAALAEAIESKAEVPNG